MTLKTYPWDPAEELDTTESIVAYFDAALEEGDPKFLASAIGTVARARGMTELARETGLSRESHYRALSEDGDPVLGTVMKVLQAFGVRLSAVSAGPESKVA